MKTTITGAIGGLSTERLLGEYLEHIRTHRDLTDSSISHHRLYASRFLNHFGGESSLYMRDRLTVGSVQDFASCYAGSHGPGSNRWMFSTLRVLLQHLYLAGHLPSDLSSAVPSIQCRRLSHVPRGICEQDIKRLLGSIDRTKAIGKRDYAMILMLSTYGVRGAQVRRLKLGDVHWNEDQIIFEPAKGGKRIIQHLTAAVGNSLFDYLREARPDVAGCEAVFLSSGKGTPQPLRDPRELSAAISRRLKSADIELPKGVSYGSHSFRHAFAKRMVNNSEPFKHVADMLGHKVLDSTMIYTKIDLPCLRQATIEWPEVHS